MADARAGSFQTEWTDQANNVGQLAITTSPTTQDSVYTNESNTNAGVSIYVRVVIHNNNHPSLQRQTLQLAVDGQDATSQWDLINATCSDPAVIDHTDISDIAYHNLLPRPNIHDLGTNGDDATYDDEGTGPGEPNEQIIKTDTQQQ